MIVIPINPELPSIIKRLFDAHGARYWCVSTQFRVDNYIVNASFGVKECLVLDDHGVVIDGFVTTAQFDVDDFKYKDKSFFELLGGISNKSTTASPIDKLLYINNIDTYTPQLGVERYS
jgi:hypothetical protein